MLKFRHKARPKNNKLQFFVEAAHAAVHPEQCKPHPPDTNYSEKTLDQKRRECDCNRAVMERVENTKLFEVLKNTHTKKAGGQTGMKIRTK